MTLKRALLVLGTLLAVLLGGAAPASAHAALIRTDPAQGTVLDSAPKRIALTFSEGVLLGDDSIRVLDPSGRRVDSGTPDHTDQGSATAAVALSTGLPDGTFTVVWKAVSEDSHPVAGAFAFSIGAPSKTTVAVQGQEAGGGAVGTLYDVARYIAYAGFAVLIGSAVFLTVCWPRGARLRTMRRLAAGGWATLVASTIALLTLRGPYANSGGLGDAFDLGAIRDVLETRPGTALVSRLLLLAATVVFLSVLFGTYTRRDDPAERRDLAWGLGIGGSVIAVGLAATWATAEHASVGLQPALAMPVDILHLLAMAVWLGGLAALLLALFRVRGPLIERVAVQRFSRLAFASVVTLAVTGTYQSWRQLGSWDAFVSTLYGQLLLVKIGLVTVLLGAAWVSRSWTQRLGAAAAVAKPVPVTVTAAAPKEEAADPARAAQLARQRVAVDSTRAKKARDAGPERAGLRRSVLAEVAVAVVVLAVTTALTGTQPGRAATEEAGLSAATATEPQTPQPLTLVVPYDTGSANGKGEATVSLDPGRVGNNEMHVLTTGTDGEPVDPPEVKVGFTLKAKGIGPLSIGMGKLDTGHWSAPDVVLPIAGTWEVSVTVRTSDIDQVTETKSVKIE